MPAPVLTLDGPDTIPTLAPGQSIQVMYTATNYGLIAIQDAQFGFLSNDDYDLIPLTNNIGTIPAMSSIQIPVLIRAKDATRSDVSASGTNPTPLCSAFTAFVKGFNLCGVTLVQWVAFHASFFPIYTLACIADGILAQSRNSWAPDPAAAAAPAARAVPPPAPCPPAAAARVAAPHPPSLTTSRGPRRRAPGTTSAADGSHPDRPVRGHDPQRLRRGVGARQWQHHGQLDRRQGQPPVRRPQRRPGERQVHDRGSGPHRADRGRRDRGRAPGRHRAGEVHVHPG